MADIFEQAAVVLHPFGGYAKGDVIRDQGVVASIRKSANAGSIILTQVPVAPAASAGREKV